MASCNLSSFSIDKQAILLHHIKNERLDVINIQESHWDSSVFKDNVSKAAKFFSPCKIYGTPCSPNDKAAGILTIIKGTLHRKVISFEVLVSGRVSCLKLETDYGVVNIINWYGVQKYSSEFQNILTKLSEYLLEAMFHSEHVIIMGDLNINTLFGSEKRKASAFNEWLQVFNLNDLVPCPTRPSFKSSRGSKKPYSTRPDHIVSSLLSSQLWDVEMFLQHKMVCAEFQLFDLESTAKFEEVFNMSKFNNKAFTENLDCINSKIASFSGKDLQSFLTELCSQYHSPIRKSPLITDIKEYRDLERIRRALQKAKWSNRPNKIAKEFMATVGVDNAIVAYKDVVKKQQNVILSALKARKEAFKKAVNNLKSSVPYRYAFKSERNSSSVFKISDPTQVTEHFEKMFNTALGDSNLDEKLITGHPKLAEFRVPPANPGLLANVVSRMKHSMPGSDKVPMIVFKSMNEDALLTVSKNNPLEYLGASFINNMSWSPSDDKVLLKVESRLLNFRPKHLRLGPMRNVILSKVLSVPRYLSSVDAIPLSLLEKLEVKISGIIKKRIGCDNRLSKAVIYGDKSQGGLGLLSPVDISHVERMASVCRFVNSTSPITQKIARAMINKALKGETTDSLWKNAAATMKDLKYYFKSTDNGWVLCNHTNHKPVSNLRNAIIETQRSKKIINKLGQLDNDYNWHNSTLSFWRNSLLSYYQQRLLYFNLHHSILLGDDSTCDKCNVKEDWTHAFQTCPKCNPEKDELYATWDAISQKFSINKIRFPPDISESSQLRIEFDGRCSRNYWLNWSKRKKIPKYLALEVYKALAIYLENCYKNSVWYNRPNASFTINRKYLSAYHRQAQSNQPLSVNP
ncbi:predicted protein [Naegleria gruberi]|uniref:Predicted protein n=1 Tax=Naegleria gruberi TaxID=5762 RepID=D2VI07_NAEGR|nr:uncharacterized protein NAEGRDRAFT_68513 [Naegleria gruberi]EFC43434.1 predicted protein [Naegleria gruberi]|eukprot:XP_002676178.1 predicted protein [Naegleria gruberi strain NEG-M]